MKKSLWEKFSKWFINQINIDEVEDYKNGKEKLKEAFPNVKINKVKTGGNETAERIDTHDLVEEAKNDKNDDTDDADADGIYDLQQQNEREEAEAETQIEAHEKQKADNQQQ